MSEFVDETLGRYVDQQSELRATVLSDPVQNMRIQDLRQTLDAMERALAAEGIAEEVRRRAINRIVWGDPEGLTDVHGQREAMIRQMEASGSNVAASATGLVI